MIQISLGENHPLFLLSFCQYLSVTTQIKSMRISSYTNKHTTHSWHQYNCWNKHFTHTTSQAITLHCCFTAFSMVFVLPVLHDNTLDNQLGKNYSGENRALGTQSWGLDTPSCIWNPTDLLWVKTRASFSHMHTYTHKYTHTCMQSPMYLCVYVCMCVCMHACMS
jgi:hypothetical protein